MSYKIRRGGNRIAVFVLVIVIILLSIIPVLAETEGYQEQQILEFERRNPAYDEAVEVGTQKEELRLPATLRAILPLSKESDPVSFVQAEPKADMTDGSESYDYYYYGYVRPKDAKAMYEEGEKVIYTIYYGGETSGEAAYRVYGMLGGETAGNQWFACDEAGTVTGVIKEVPVTWEEQGYDPDSAGEYTFSAEVEDYTYEAESPTARIYVGDQEENNGGTPPALTRIEGNATEDSLEIEEGLEQQETVEDLNVQEPAETNPLEDDHCGVDGEPLDDSNYPWAHQEDCIYFSPMECTCKETVEVTIDNTVHEQKGSIDIEVPGEFSYVHDPQNRDCVLYGRDTVRIKKLSTGKETIMAKEDAERIVAFQNAGEQKSEKNTKDIGASAEDGILYKALGKIEIITDSEQSGNTYDSNMELLSVNGGGTNDVWMDNFIATNAKTSGSAQNASGYGTTPGYWIDYLNTIFRNENQKFYWTPHAQVNAYNGWLWSGVTANQSTGTVTTNPRRIPAVSAGYWDVYSGEQLRYALEHQTTGSVVRLRANIDLNGNQYNWTCLERNNALTQMYSNYMSTGDTESCYGLYNLGSRDGGLLYNLTAQGSSLRSINFYTSKVLSNGSKKAASLYEARITAESVNVNVYSCLLYDSLPADNGFLSSAAALGSGESSTFTRCSVIDSIIYGGCHVAAIAIQGDGASFNRCFTTGSKVFSVGGHSGGLHSCLNTTSTSKECFVSVEMYGSIMVGGYSVSAANNMDCYTTGKLEGYDQLAGLYVHAEQPDKVERNYSTMLVGIRTDMYGNMGGALCVNVSSNGQNQAAMQNVYVAGEVGNARVNLEAAGDTGGFVAASTSKAFNNCYYDKQTTAMREWAAGNTKTLTGVTGVLTSSSSSNGTGLASGTYGGAADKGFRGFSDNSYWTYTSEHYPQLKTFSNATAAAWGSAERANLVQAYSRASTATVFLDTWDEGYDWDDHGLRTGSEVSYNRTLASTGKSDHKGFSYTYDTVREMVSDFQVTKAASWTQLIPGGAPTDSNGDGQPDLGAMNVSSSGGGQIKNAGMDWYDIGETVGNVQGHRPIRLISYMQLEAGQDQELTSGDYYNHRSDVALTMMNDITDNLVIGLDNGEIWSTAKEGGYPKSDRFWAAETDNMETNFSASKEAWLYTEISRAKHDGNGDYERDQNGNLVPEWSVQVTGPGTGSNGTLAEKRWNGDEPVFLDISRGRKYIITYYWMLKDGRYRTDQKVVTLKPRDYQIDVNVKNIFDDSGNDTALQLGVAADQSGVPAYTYSTNPEQHAGRIDIPYTEDNTAAWKKKWPTNTVKKIKLELTQTDTRSGDKVVMGSKTITGDDLVEGTVITIPTVRYYYLDTVSTGREVSGEQTIDVSYTVQKDSQGGYYLQFNKLKNIPSDEDPDKILYGTDEGIASVDSGGATNLVYFNEAQYDVDLTLWVQEGLPFEFIKINEKGEPMVDVQFAVFPEGDLETPIKEVTSNVDGKVTFTDLTTGKYILVETKTNAGYALPQGQWILTIDTAANTAQIKALGEEGNLPPAFMQETAEDGSIIFKLPNYKKVILPDSGSFSTLLFTIGGVIMISIVLMLHSSGKKRERGK